MADLEFHEMLEEYGLWLITASEGTRVNFNELLFARLKGQDKEAQYDKFKLTGENTGLIFSGQLAVPEEVALAFAQFSPELRVELNKYGQGKHGKKLADFLEANFKSFSTDERYDSYEKKPVLGSESEFISRDQLFVLKEGTTRSGTIRDILEGFGSGGANNRADRVKRFRLSNPPGREKLKSFAEILEDSLQEKDITFGKFLKKVFTVWGVTKDQFLEHFNKGLEEGKKLDPAVLRQWLKDFRGSLTSDSIEKFRKVFNLDSRAETDLWKLTSGKKLTLEEAKAKLEVVKDVIKKNPIGEDNKTPAIIKLQKAELLRLLKDASGIAEDRAAELLGCSAHTVRLWHSHAPKKYRTPTDPELLGPYLDYLLQNIVISAKEPHLQRELLKRDIIDTITGFELSKEYKDQLKEAEESDPPQAAMMKKIALKSGITIKAVFDEAAPDMPKSRTDSIMSGKVWFTEEQAEKIMAVADYNTPDEYQRSMLLLTGYDDPLTLIKKAEDSIIDVRRVLRDTMSRRGHSYVKNPIGLNSSPYQYFLTEGRPCREDAAKVFAEYIFGNGPNRKKERASFVSMAIVERKIDPSAVMDRVEDGTFTAKKGLQLLAGSLPLSKSLRTSQMYKSEALNSGIIPAKCKKEAVEEFARNLGFTDGKVSRMASLFYEPELSPGAIALRLEKDEITYTKGFSLLLSRTGKDNNYWEAKFGVGKIVLDEMPERSPKFEAMLDEIENTLTPDYKLLISGIKEKAKGKVISEILRDAINYKSSHSNGVPRP